MSRRRKTQKNIRRRFLNHLKEPITIDSLADTFDTTKKHIHSEIRHFRDRGFHIKKEKEHYFLQLASDPELHTMPIPERVTFAVMGDTHLASKHECLEELADYYKWAEDSGAEFVVHAGDLVQGIGVFKGEASELLKFTMEDQLQYFIDEYPESELQTFYIFGNHDLKQFEAGKSPHPRHVLESAREDLTPLGDYYARIQGEDTDITIDLLHPAGGSSYARCFDDKTDILTEEGWKSFVEISKEDRIATLSDNGFFEWEHPTHITNEDYEGEMLHFTSRNVDLLVTPNHRMFTRRYPLRANKKNKRLRFPQKARQQCDYSWKFVEAKDLVTASRQQWQFMRGGADWEGDIAENIIIPKREPKKYASTPVKHLGTIPIDDIAELMAWYVTEGHIDKKQKQLVICQSQKINPENHSRIISLLERLGLHYNARGKENKDISACSVELCDYLIKQCGSGSRNKHLPNWLKNQTKEILGIVFETMIAGDGWISTTGYGYKSISKKLRHDLTEIAIKLGYAVTTNKDSLHITSVQILPTLNNPPQSKKYKGTIHCVTVPNQKILVRRNGKIIWSGNSYRPQKYIEQLTPGAEPSILVWGHHHDALYLPYRGVHTFKSASFQGHSNFARRLGLPGIIGGWLLTIEHDGSEINTIQSEFKEYRGG